jgi:hypothetical protein
VYFSRGRCQVAEVLWPPVPVLLPFPRLLLLLHTILLSTSNDLLGFTRGRSPGCRIFVISVSSSSTLSLNNTQSTMYGTV